MTVFGDYARWYELLYQDKDYVAEVEYVDNLIQLHNPKATTVLELGCGTGGHAIPLAEQGYHVCGVDLSQGMLNQATARRDLLPKDVASRLSFVRNDVRNLKFETRFDVIVSLFHVLSYQVENQDLDDTFASIAGHLNSDGIVIFDCWYGPGVLSDHPRTRVKHVHDGTTSVTRIAEPAMHPNTNTVEIGYNLFVDDQATGIITQVKERHTMRYLFTPEIQRLMAAAGLNMLGVYEWMTLQKPGLDSWNACYVAQNNGRK